MAEEPECHKVEWTRLEIGDRSWRVKLEYGWDEQWSALAIGDTFIEAMGRGASRAEVLDTLAWRLQN